MLTDLKNRGVLDILILTSDGLTGIQEAVEAGYPQATYQGCVVHVIRNSTKYVGYQFCADLKAVYQAPTEESAITAFETLEQKWGEQYPLAVSVWERNWDRISAMYQFTPEIRRLIYTTNPIEGFNRQLRKVSKNLGVFPDDDSVLKLLYLATQWYASGHKEWQIGMLFWLNSPSTLRSELPIIWSKKTPDEIHKEGVIKLTKEELSDRLLDFAARTGKLIDAIPESRLGRHIAGQLVRSGTSPAPNYEEACAAESPRDFVHKLAIVLKELRESRVWIRLIVKAELLLEAKMMVVIETTNPGRRPSALTGATLCLGTVFTRPDGVVVIGSEYEHEEWNPGVFDVNLPEPNNPDIGANVILCPPPSGELGQK